MVRELVGHTVRTYEYGDGYHEPREVSIACYCGMPIWSWMQFYEEAPDWEQNWLDHLATVEHGIVPSPIYDEFHGGYEATYVALNQALDKFTRIDCSVPGVRNGGLF